MKKGWLGMVLALALVLGVMIGCAGDSGGGGGGGGGYYQMSGTYVWTVDPVDGDDTPPVGILAITVTKSSFPDDCGAQEGDPVIDATVELLTETAMTLTDLPDPEGGISTFVGARAAGALEDVVGTWRGGMDTDAGIWTIIIEDNGTFIVRATLNSCL